MLVRWLLLETFYVFFYVALMAIDVHGRRRQSTSMDVNGRQPTSMDFGPQDMGQGRRTKGQRAFWGWAQARAQWPMTWVLCPMALSYVPCPMALSYVLWPEVH